MALHVYAIPQVEPPSVGNHLIWMGPHTWGYSLKGWDIQRRVWRPAEEITCDRLQSTELADLRANYEMELRFGTIRFRSGNWPEPIIPVASKLPSRPIPCEVYTLDFHTQQRYTAVQATAAKTFCIAFRQGKAVAARLEAGPAPVRIEFREVAIDTLMVYVISPQELSFCIALPIGDEALSWRRSKIIVQGLQLPLKELIPSLSNAEDEYTEAQRRLLPGESLNREEFERVANILRTSVSQAGPPRPLDQVLLLRENPNEPFEELKALDPISAILPHPKWRRVLGFGWFDNDPQLVIGETYEYRITGYFPKEDMSDTVYGFHTVPSGVFVPTSFFLGPIHFHLSQPTPVVLVPEAPQVGNISISRRGIRIPPGNVLNPQIVIDFPKPIKTLILELQPGHQLTYIIAPGQQSSGFMTVPSGSRPQLQLPNATTQIRLFGQGILLAVRIPDSPSSQQVPISAVLPPVKLENTPRPEPPVWARIDNLQKMIPSPAMDAAPSEITPRHALGFEIRLEAFPQRRSG